MNKTNADMFINELSEGNEFGLGKGVHGTNRRGSTLLQVDLQIIRSMWGQRIGLSLTEDVSVVMILFRNVGEVGNFVGDGSRTGGDGGVGKMNPKTLRSRQLHLSGKCTEQRWKASEKQGSVEGAELPWQTMSGLDMTDQGAVDGR